MSHPLFYAHLLQPCPDLLQTATESETITMADKSGSSSPVDRRPRNFLSRFRRNSRQSYSESTQGEAGSSSGDTSVRHFMSPNRSSEIHRIGRGRKEKEGLLLWPNVDRGGSDIIDIVAVHGLQGDFEKTWEEGGQIWLRDFLGDLVPNVQVLSFGYNSLVYSPGWTNQLEDFARQLLQAVKNYRNDSDRKKYRPIIFLGHSLGGLIIKKVRNFGAEKHLPKAHVLIGSHHGPCQIVCLFQHLGAHKRLDIYGYSTSWSGSGQIGIYASIYSWSHPSGTYHRSVR
ncbi:hypothetical protein BKA65DRAFT_75179 [Rhexocercosporidium sp. MPI-PUGE-AT-0058]|nr:hypothetical protein BKA65DRAFT_75179 [Rhexocercosporidium sp. MPI-PUGE-AT-0058]